MNEERRRKLDEAIADVVNTAMKMHHSSAAVAQVLATSLQVVTANLLEELAELDDRVKQLESMVDAEDDE